MVVVHLLGEPEFFKSFQMQLELGGDEMYQSLSYILSNLGDSNKALIGVKKLVVNYLFLLIPIKGQSVVAWESNETGHATYFFRATPDEIREIAEGLRDANFRREPIYLTDADLLKPEYKKYLFAVKVLPRLQFLRQRFLGRASHTSFEDWKSQAEKVLWIRNGR